MSQERQENIDALDQLRSEIVLNPWSVICWLKKKSFAKYWIGTAYTSALRLV
jgi:hypothetical protein